MCDAFYCDMENWWEKKKFKGKTRALKENFIRADMSRKGIASV